MKKTTYTCCMAGLLLIAACGAKNEAESKSISAPGKTNALAETVNITADTVGSGGGSAAPVNDPLTAQMPRITPKLIRTADLRFQVKDISRSGEHIEKMAAAYQAYISNASLNSTNTESRNAMTLRVPNENFDALLHEAARESIFMERKNVSTQDVTEEYVDIVTRIKTKKEVEARYIDILRSKAKTVHEVLEAEEQIRQIREEIEAREGRLKFLQNQVSYSTIHLELYQQVEYHENPQELTESFGSKAGSGFSEGWQFIQNLLLGFITVWPLWLILGLVFFFIRKKRMQRKARA